MTLNLNDDLLRRASELAKVHEKTALVHIALRSLIAELSAGQLARLGGTQPKLRGVPRRRGVKTGS
jgi:Arc/MetJ family transcription regulator